MSMQQRESNSGTLLHKCTNLQREREELIRNFSNPDKWPVYKSDLVNKHIKHFTQFVNSIDFERLISLNNLTVRTI